jgi:hypothetical protein
MRFIAAKRAANAALPGYADVGLFDPDREGGHLLPNLDINVKTERAGESVRFVTNSKGFRNSSEFDYERPEGVRRILFVGDSFVDGMRTDQEATIGFLLQKFLNRDNPAADRFEVIISGHNNPTNAWYHFQEHGYKYHPDIVLVGVTLGNDLTSNTFKVSFLPKADQNGRIFLEEAIWPRQAFRRHRNLMLPEAAYSPESVMDGIWDLEMVLRRYLSEGSIFFSQWSAPLIAGENYRRRVHAGGNYASLELFYRPIMAETEEVYRDFEAVLWGFGKEVARRGSRFVVALFPTRMQVSKSDWSVLVRAYSFDETRFDLDYPNQRIHAFCAGRDMVLIDTLPELRRLDGQGGGPLFRGRGDMHFNERGQEAVAGVLAQSILEGLRNDWASDSQTDFAR